MKRIILTAIALLTSCFAFGTDNARLSVEGVSSYTRTEYTVATKFGDYFRSISSKHIHNFTNGIETECSSYNGKDELTDRVSYKYDSEFNLTGVVSEDSTGTVCQKIEYEYSDGLLKSFSTYDGDGNLTGKSILKYEKNRKEQNDYDGTGKLAAKIISVFDDSDKPLEVYVYNGDGSLGQKESYYYDDEKRLSSVIVLVSEDEVSEKSYYRYDVKGFVSEIQIYDGSDVLKQRHVYKNDPLGNPVRISIYDVAQKFGTTVNELVSMSDYSYKR